MSKQPKVSSIVFSPPYSEGIGHAAGKNASRNYSWRLKLQKKMTEAWGNGSIAKLRYGDKAFGSILFSPPYFNAIESVSTGHQGPEGGHLERQHKLAKDRKSGYGNKSNIGHTENYGSIIFSPPYFNALKRGDEGPHSRSKRIPYEDRVKRFQGYSSDSGNIGNIPNFGSIVFSPPYEGALNSSKHVGGIASRDPQLAKTGQYSKDRKNIGNTTGQTYLGAMLKVYSECHRVLKPGKFMVVVVKDIQRCWKTIPIGADTIKLCQLAGFDLHDIIINKMYFPSFWMLNLAKKAQTEANKGTKKFHALKDHEYILVFRKP